MAVFDGTCPLFIEKVLDFSQGLSYELLEPLTGFRKNQDGTPTEGRILFTCRQLSQNPQQRTENKFVIKIKVQVPDKDQEPESGPSTTTAAELKALEAFARADNPYVPHLVACKSTIQGPDGLLPGGYITYTVMTKMSGQNLLDLQYWTILPEEREEIVREFWQALRSICNLGIEPMDRALRNVIWDRETKRCTIVDFEVWRETNETTLDEIKELQRWGLVRRPAPKSWWAEWSWHDT